MATRDPRVPALAQLAGAVTRTRAGHWRADRCTVYVGRGSDWGNPFVRRGTTSRYAVTVVEDPIGAYEAYVLTGPLRARLAELRGHVLGCFCVRADEARPTRGAERCHAQVLARLADETLVRVTAAHFCAGLVALDGRVIEAAPILAWARGRAWPEVGWEMQARG